MSLLSRHPFDVEKELRGDVSLCKIHTINGSEIKLTLGSSKVTNGLVRIHLTVSFI